MADSGESLRSGFGQYGRGKQDLAGSDQPVQTSNNYKANTVEPDHNHQFDIKADYQLTERDRLFGRESYQRRDDGEGRPSSADYVSDSDFWFNLPANFDLLDAGVRMGRWSGDDSYRNDPVFQRFFRSTMSDYIRTWQLGRETILKRPRIANQRQAEGRFVHSRGVG